MEQSTALKRRGILAAAGAVVAGIVVKQAAQPVAAATPMLFADTTTPVTNSVKGETRLVGPAPEAASVLVADATGSPGNGSIGLFGRGAVARAGVIGMTTGVQASDDSLNWFSGVLGIGDEGTTGGVIGIAHALYG